MFSARLNRVPLHADVVTHPQLSRYWQALSHLSATHWTDDTRPERVVSRNTRSVDQIPNQKQGYT